MAFQPFITTMQAPANTGMILMARIRGYAYELVNQATFTGAAPIGITYTLQDLTLGTQQDSQILVVANVIFNSLQQSDPWWTKDNQFQPSPPPPNGDGSWGYNFRWIVPAAKILNGGDRYQADVAFTPVGGNQPFRVSWQWATFPVFA